MDKDNDTEKKNGNTADKATNTGNTEEKAINTSESVDKATSTSSMDLRNVRGGSLLSIKEPAHKHSILHDSKEQQIIDPARHLTFTEPDKIDRSETEATEGEHSMDSVAESAMSMDSARSVRSEKSTDVYDKLMVILSKHYDLPKPEDLADKPITSRCLLPVFSRPVYGHWDSFNRNLIMFIWVFTGMMTVSLIVYLVWLVGNVYFVEYCGFYLFVNMDGFFEILIAMCFMSTGELRRKQAVLKDL